MGRIFLTLKGLERMSCTICDKPIEGGEIIVIGGRANHKDCYNATKTETGASSSISNLEVCKVCGKEVEARQEKIIIGGSAQHRECYMAGQTEKVGSSGIDNDELCPVCEKVVGSSDKIIVSGKE